MTNGLPKFLIPERVPKEVVMLGIMAITLLMSVGLVMGHNGVLLSTTIAIIALSIGIVIPTVRLK